MKVFWGFGMDKIVLSVLGKINSGKSTLVNSLAKENVCIVSKIRGSTSDCVTKMTEIDGLGRVKLVDTAGYDDEGVLSKERLEKVEQAFLSSDFVIVLCKNDCDDTDRKWLKKCEDFEKKYILCHNIEEQASVKILGKEIWLDCKNIEHTAVLIKAILQYFADENKSILGDLVKRGQSVLLCMPQDDGAPKGRLILPQSIVIREILDIGGIPIIAGKDNFANVFEEFKDRLSLVITDSGEFEMVYKKVCGSVPITSFSILFAKYNGDIQTFIQGAEDVQGLQNGDKVLIIEACSHTLSHKDIGSVKIPALIKKYTKKNIEFDFIRGKDAPNDLTNYKLVVHCGGCTQNREFIMSRVEKCKKLGVPITNYGVLIAKITGILDKIVF